MFRKNKALIKELSTPPNARDLHFPTQYSQPFFTECITCLWKQRLFYWWNLPYSAVRRYTNWFSIPGSWLYKVNVKNNVTYGDIVWPSFMGKYGTGMCKTVTPHLQPDPWFWLKLQELIQEKATRYFQCNGFCVLRFPKCKLMHQFSQLWLLRKFFYREQAAGMHSAFPYALDMYFTKVSGFIREISVSYI